MLSPLHSLHNLSQPPDMYSRILRKLWMEATPKNIALPYRNDILRPLVFMFLILLQIGILQGQHRHNLNLSIQFLLGQLIHWRLTRRHNRRIEMADPSILSLWIREM
jgi:hypothetical protein